MTRVFLVDDHQLVRAGMRALLDPVADIDVVGESANGLEAQAGVIETEPDVVILDVTMPDLDGVEVARLLKERHPTLRILMVSMHLRPEVIERALSAGADGYMFKHGQTLQLVEAIRTVARGQTFLPPGVELAMPGSTGSESEPLTPRQRQVLRLIAEGKSTKAIAGELEISVKTVEHHRAALSERLGIRDIAGLVRHALAMGLIEPD